MEPALEDDAVMDFGLFLRVEALLSNQVGITHTV